MVETPHDFVWKGPDYGARKLLGGKIGFKGGAFIVDGFTTPPAERRGSFWTSISISDMEYRRSRPTKVAYEAGYRDLTIYCDWGHAHHIHAHEEVIKELVCELEQHEIPQVKERVAAPREDK